MLRLNPVYKRELKQNARMKKSALMLFFYNTLLTIFGIFALYLIYNSRWEKGYKIIYSDILKIYGIIIGIEFVLVLCIIPALTAGAIAGEREKQTLDILLTTKVTPFQIITGKLNACISMTVLLAVSSMPVVAIVFSIGGITLWNLVEVLILIVVTAIFIGSIGIFFSTSCKKTTSATVCTYMALFFITGGLALLFVGARILQESQLQNAAANAITNYAARQQEDQDFVLILTLNPIFSFLSLLGKQTGIGSDISEYWNTQDKFRYWIAAHWMEISLSVQLVVSWVLLMFTSRMIKNRKR